MVIRKKASGTPSARKKENRMSIPADMKLRREKQQRSAFDHDRINGAPVPCVLSSIGVPSKLLSDDSG
jgi:hypothetical protein